MLTTLALTTLLLTAQDKAGLAGPIAAKTTEGKALTIPVPESKATVLVFLYTDCPIANRYAPELKRIEEEYSKQKVSFVRVYVYKEATPASISQHTKDYGYKSPAVHDASHAIVKALEAKVTPEVAVLLPDLSIAYKGRIDDMYVEHGRLREGGYRRDLRIALDEVVAGKRVTLARTPALGCFIGG